ncbi:hypothetical protein OLP54_00365, partial [Agrobacterium sp. MAFF310724]|uniref:hypothetical protein n=1 Tax=unclassified Agrobacterium TaxID=2632611 RepID=UPI0022F25B4B
SQWMLNQLPLAPSLHNRFIDHRICSSDVVRSQSLGRLAIYGCGPRLAFYLPFPISYFVL